MTSVAYILPIRNGIPPFIYDELLELEKSGISFELFPTYYQPGLKAPKPNWKVHPIRKSALILGQIRALIRHPIEYTLGLFHSIKHHALAPFVVAAYQEKRISKLDRIHCHFGDSKFFIGYYAHRLTKKPYSVTIHAHELWRNNMALFRDALSQCDRVFPISKFNANILIQDFGVPSTKITQNYLFVDTELFTPEAQTESGGKKVKLLTVAAFHKKKGHDLVFAALKRLERDDIEYCIVGKYVPGISDVDVREVAREMDVQNKVVFLGQLTGNPLLAAYHDCDVFVQVSRTVDNNEGEGIPVGLMEAMACGKPVISTYHKGIPELVERELIKEEDVSALASAIARLADDPSLRKAQGARNRQIIEEKFSRRNVQILRKYFEGKPVSNT